MIDPVRLEIFRHLFEAVPEEMGEVLRRSARSPNIKERRDYSCAVFDSEGDTVAQAAHVPVHLGSMPASVKAALGAGVAPGDVVMLNDPFAGGTHLPDITLVAGAFDDPSAPAVFLVAVRAHHADVGGMSPGSLPLSREIYHEGLVLPPVHLIRRGELQEDLLALVLRNVRTPEERRGDLTAQLSALRLGVRRLEQLIRERGKETVRLYGRALQDYAETMTRALLRHIPDGTYTFADVLDDDGQGAEDVRIAVAFTVDGDEAVVDFTGSAAETLGNVNAVAAVTRSAVFYVLRSLLDEEVPANEGVLRPVRLVVPEGTVLGARPPRAVAAGNVETSQRIVDVLLGALAQALPDRIPAASQGTMNNLAFGGLDDRLEEPRPFAYYETLAGGAGAGPGWEGTAAVHSHMTNTMNTPVEALEHDLPVAVLRYAIRRGSGGRGRFPGGDGVVRLYRFLVPTDVTLLTERRRHGPFGLAGGEAGQPGRQTLRTPDGRVVALPGKWHGRVEAGTVLEVETPGGGGFGRPIATAARADGEGRS